MKMWIQKPRSERVAIMDGEKLHEIITRKNLEHEYVDTETKLITMFKVVESIKRQFCNKKEEVSSMPMSRKGAERIKELCDDIEKIKDEFESIERPLLVIETATVGAEPPSNGRPQKGPSIKQDSADKLESNEGRNLELKAPKHVPEVPSGESSKNIDTTKHIPEVPSEERSKNIETPNHITDVPSEEKSKIIETPKHTPEVRLEESSENIQSPTVKHTTETLKTEQGKLSKPPEGKGEKSSNLDENLLKLDSEVEKDTEDQSTEEVGGWEFDELEKELKEHGSPSRK